MKKYFNILITVLLILSNHNLQTAPFDTGMIELHQPDETTFIGRIWGDEFFSWAETEEGYRFIQSGDGWYYYATLDENGEYFPTGYKVGVDEPQAESYQLERTKARIDEINQHIEEFNEMIQMNNQWFEQLQEEAQGQTVPLKVGIIVIEFSDVSHYADPEGNRPFGYYSSDFDSLMFSYNHWIDDPGNQKHPEEEEIFGSFRDYWHQMSRGKLMIQGRVANPTDGNGVPRWLKASGTRSYYFNQVGGWELALEAYQLAIDSGYISEEPTDSNYFHKICVVYAGEAISGIMTIGGDLDGILFYLPERIGPMIFGGGPLEKSFTHIGLYAHEFGHTIGLHDEYLGGGGSIGGEDGGTDIFNFCLMAWGEHLGPLQKGECPATLSAYFRIEKDWVNLTVLEEDEDDFVVAYNYSNPNFYKINPIESTNDEHYILETKNRDGFDLYIPGNPADTVDQPGRLIVWQHNTHSNYTFWPDYNDRIRIKPADDKSNHNTQINDFFPAYFSMNNDQDFNDLTEPGTTINETHPYFAIPGIPAHFALNGIQKLSNGNTLIDELRIHYPLRIINNNSGNWQTVSVPGTPDDYSASSVFPSLVNGTIYKYQSGYILVSTLENGPGYYAKFPNSPQTIILDGNPIEYLEIAVNSGWNLAGSISYKIPIPNLCTDPPGILTGDIYYYDGGNIALTEEDSLKPGIGYWIKTNSVGDLILNRFAEPCELPKLNSFPHINYSEMDKFIITDSAGFSQSLYVTNTDIDTIMANVDRELPPFFNQLDFDSRFEYNEFIKKVSADSGTINLNILVHTISYPVSLSWELNPENGISYTFDGDSILGKESDIETVSGMVSFNKLSNNKIQLLAKVDGNNLKSLLPSKYALYQNYPNPFNPVTTIKYDLPNASEVSLVIYDILGRKVKELVNTKQQTGRYEVSFNASSLASGIYIYQLIADKFYSAKKMIMLK